MKHVFERDVPMTTRDGVILRANVWRPVEGKAPTLLIRIPYGKNMEAFAGNDPTSLLPSVSALLDAGYAVIHQDVRGTSASDGEFEPKINEISDGQDTLAWLAEQDWYDGTVGTYGASYMGMAQWALAISDNPGLKAIAPSVTAANWYTGLWYSPGGALSLSLVTVWTTLMAFGAEQRALERGETTDPSRMMQLGGALKDPLALNNATPVADVPLIGKGRWFDDWLAHPDHDDYWAAQDWTTSINGVTVPALFSTGWYDLKIPGTMADFVQSAATGCGSACRWTSPA
jgi:putative CocE/NonD family hydrolase